MLLVFILSAFKKEGISETYKKEVKSGHKKGIKLRLMPFKSIYE